jgi:flagellar biosynthesis/type III secretory pathway protein FliH
MSTSAPHPATALFPDLDLPPQAKEEAPEAWAPGHEHEPEPDFVLLFQQSPPRPIGPSVSAMLAEAREEAFSAGLAAGREAEQGSREAAVAESLSRIANAVADARWAADVVAEETAAEMGRLVSDVLALVLRGLAERTAGPDAMAFAAGLLPALTAEPRIDIRAAPGIVPALAEQLAAQPSIHVAADPALPDGDVRIGWRDGQAEHRSAAFRSAILGVIAGLLAPSGDQHVTSTGTEK